MFYEDFNAKTQRRKGAKINEIKIFFFVSLRLCVKFISFVLQDYISSGVPKNVKAFSIENKSRFESENLKNLE